MRVSVPTGEDGRLSPQEAERLRLWIEQAGGTTAAFCERHGYSPARLSRILNCKPDGGVSVNALRGMVAQTGHELWELFKPDEVGVRPLTLEDVQAGLHQASVDMERWARLLRERQSAMRQIPDDPEEWAAWVVQEAQRRGVPVPRIQAASPAEPHPGGEAPPAAAGRRSGRRGK